MKRVINLHDTLPELKIFCTKEEIIDSLFEGGNFLKEMGMFDPAVLLYQEIYEITSDITIKKKAKKAQIEVSKARLEEPKEKKDVLRFVEENCSV